ncbi:MAG: hypothetical protein AAGE94_15155 [Acidobacteriota bacterium]
MSDRTPICRTRRATALLVAITLLTAIAPAASASEPCGDIPSMRCILREFWNEIVARWPSFDDQADDHTARRGADRRSTATPTADAWATHGPLCDGRADELCVLIEREIEEWDSDVLSIRAPSPNPAPSPTRRQ